MKDRIVLACLREIAPEPTFKLLHDANKPILEFLSSHKLITQEAIERNIEIYPDILVRESDFVGNGGQIFIRAKQKHLRSVGRGRKMTDMTIFEKEYGLAV